MAKRFIDNTLFRKDFIRGLQAPYKLLWIYILTECDHAGLWDVEIEVAAIRLGISVDEKTAIQSFGDKIQVVNGGSKWFVSDFIEFQYGELNPKNRVHESVLNLLKKYKIKPLTSPLQGAKDKDKDKDKEIPTESEFVEYGILNSSKDYDNALRLKYRAWVADGWKDGNGKKVLNWQSKLLNTIQYLKPTQQESKSVGMGPSLNNYGN